MARAAAGADRRRRQRCHHRFSRRPPETRHERTGRQLSRCRPAGHQPAPDRNLAPPDAANQPRARVRQHGEPWQCLPACHPARRRCRLPAARQRAHRRSSLRGGHPTPGTAATGRNLCRPHPASPVVGQGGRPRPDRRSAFHYRRRRGRRTGPARRRVRPRPARVPARRRGRANPRAAARQPRDLSVSIRGYAGSPRGVQRRAETHARQHPAPHRFARRRRDPARRVRQRRPLHPAHRTRQPAAVGGRHRHRLAPSRAAPLRPGSPAALLRRHHRAIADALRRPAADAGAAGQRARRGDRRADAAGAGAAGPARRRHPSAGTRPGAGGGRHRQRPAGAGGRQPARADAADPRAAAARAAARPAAAAGCRLAQRGRQRVGAVAADCVVCG